MQALRKYAQHFTKLKLMKVRLEVFQNESRIEALASKARRASVGVNIQMRENKQKGLVLSARGGLPTHSLAQMSTGHSSCIVLAFD